VKEITVAFEELGADSNIKAIVITGAGDRGFVAGADINELAAMKTSQEAINKVSLGHKMANTIEGINQPVIAAINGFALGGGTELALAADIRIAADTAKMGLPEITLGIIPGYGGTQRAPRLIGKSRAKMLIMTGDMISADEAYSLGLVDKVVPAAELMNTAKEMAKKMASRAPIALIMAKKAINDGMETDLDRGLSIEIAYGTIAQMSEDRVEGTTAFLEKRKAQWKGR
jgi:enoyl-CoA hydratase